MDFRFLCRNHAPAAFRLHASHMTVGIGIAMTHAAAMWYLIKTVGCGDRADFNGFKQYIVTWVAHGHSSIVPESASLCAAFAG